MSVARDLMKDVIPILEADSTKLGEAICNTVNDPYSGSFDEIGDDLKALINKVLTTKMDPLEVLDKTLAAVSGERMYGLSIVMKRQASKDG